MGSHANNYGRYQVPSHSQNTAFLLEINKRFEKLWGIELGVALSGDFGTQYGNQFGGYISIAKTGTLTKP